jgi:hypothetical protein
MNFIEQLTAISLLIDFLFGVTFGVVGGAILGSIRGDREGTLLRPASEDPVGAGARVIHGVYTRDDGYMQSLLHRGGQAAKDPHGDDSSGSQGQGLDR